MKKVEKLLKLGEDIKIVKIEEINREKIIHIESKKNKVRCPECKKFTKSIHGHLKPMIIKDLKIEEQHSKLVVSKRRFKCYNCNKIFTEEMKINEKGKNISKKLRTKILQNLLDYNLSLKWIGEENNVDENTVRHILEDAMKNYPEHVRLLPRVISLDEFSADTNEGKYACIINDPIHKKTLDILPNRKKETLLQYFTCCENRVSVEVVTSDMYDPYLQVTQVMFPKAIFVVDPFHYTKHVMESLDKIRKRLQNEYGPKSNPFNLQKSGKWQREMYGKRYLYETMQNAPWLISPWYTWFATIPASAMIPPIAPVNLKESFSSTAARAKASYTFNNLSPIDRFDLKTPSGSEESWDKFHNYKAGSAGAKLLYNLTNEYFGSEDELLEFIRDVGKSPVIPNRNPVDKAERMFPFGRKYDE